MDLVRVLAFAQHRLAQARLAPTSGSIDRRIQLWVRRFSYERLMMACGEGVPPLAAQRVKCYLPRPGALRRCVHVGPVAHLVERFHGMEEVVGSSPIGST